MVTNETVITLKVDTSEVSEIIQNARHLAAENDKLRETLREIVDADALDLVPADSFVRWAKSLARRALEGCT